MVVSCFVFMLICAVIARASYETRDRLHQKRLETGELEGRLGNAQYFGQWPYRFIELLNGLLWFLWTVSVCASLFEQSRFCNRNFPNHYWSAKYTVYVMIDYDFLQCTISIFLLWKYQLWKNYNLLK